MEKDDKVPTSRTRRDESILGTKSIPRLFLRFALAGIMANMIMGINLFVDGYFISGFSVREIAGIGIAFTVVAFLRMVGVLFGVGAGAVISIRLGEGKIDEARSIMGQIVWFTFFVSILIAIFGLVFNHEIMTMFGANEESLPYAVTYSRLLWISLPLSVLAMVVSILTNIDGKPGLSMSSWIFASVFSAMLESILVGKYDMGIMGSSWANSVALSIPSLLLFYFWFGPTNLKPKWKDMKIKVKTVVRVVWTGFASFSSQLMNFIAVIIFNNLLLSYGGELHVAIFTIISGYITFLLSLVALGGMIGLQPIISYNFGAGNFDRVKQAIQMAIVFTVTLFVILTTVLIVLADPIMSFFTGGNQDLQQLGVWTAIVYNFLFGLHAISVLIAGYFEAQERNWTATCISISKILLFLFPFLFIFPIYWGVTGIWYAAPCAEIPGILITIYFIRKEFKRLKDAPIMTTTSSTHTFL